ncbi:MAG: nucleotidyltransferase domain-containing protein [Candidatus Hadarchaeales archaeon]
MGGEVLEELRGFLERVREKFGPSQVILFGSRARGEELKHSDYDLIVVSQGFEGLPFLQRLTMLYELWDLDRDADLLAYTPAEFEEKRKELGVVRKAAVEGRRLE